MRQDRILSRKDEQSKESASRKLNSLVKLLKMVKEGATGFDLAYEVETNENLPSLIHEGISFYNTFVEIGNQRVIDVPDKRKVNYKSFITIEETEKHMFIEWLKHRIIELREVVRPQSDYQAYKKSREENTEKTSGRVCKNCGAKIKSLTQKFCERCGIELY